MDLTAAKSHYITRLGVGTDRILIISIAPHSSKIGINITFKVELSSRGKNKALIFFKNAF